MAEAFEDLELFRQKVEQRIKQRLKDYVGLPLTDAVLNSIRAEVLDELDAIKTGA